MKGQQLTVFLLALAGLAVGSKNGKLKVLINSPSLGYSHMQFQGKLADLLIEMGGHSVDVFICNFIPYERRNGTEKANVIKFNATTHTKYHEMDFFTDPFKNKDVKLDTGRAEPYVNTTLQFCKDIVNDPFLIKEMKENKYDVFIGEMFDPCMFFLAELVGIPTKIISSAMPMPDEIAFSHGLQVPRSYIPSVFASSPTIEIPYKERVLNILIDIYYPILLNSLTEKMRDLYNIKFGADLPSFRDILRSSSYVFVNVHDFLDNPRPVTKKFHYIGGIAIKQPNLKHPANIEAIYQQATKGVILMSFGTLFDPNLIPVHLKSTLIRAFSHFPQYQFIWRFKQTVNDTELFAQAPNVHTVDWMDQTTILNDERTKLFISHCGQNSAIETVYSGTPVLATPLVADQNYNTALLVNRKIAIYQNIRDVTEEELVTKISTLLNDPSYSINAKVLSAKLHDEPFKPAERFIKLVEYAAKHPNNGELDLYETKLTFIIRHHLDIYIPLLASVIIFAYILFKMTRLLIRVLFYVMSLKKQKVA